MVCTLSFSFYVLAVVRKRTLTREWVQWRDFGLRFHLFRVVVCSRFRVFVSLFHFLICWFGLLLFAWRTSVRPVAAAFCGDDPEAEVERGETEDH
jgi:hypothetical protein